MDLTRLFCQCDEEVKLNISYLHGRAYSSSNCFLFGESVGIEISIPRTLGTKAITLNLFDDEGNIADYKLDWCRHSSGDDIYFVKIKNLNTGLYFFNLTVFTYYDTLYVKQSFGSYVASKTVEQPYNFQITVSDFKYEAPSKYAGGVIYHIFVDRFNYTERMPLKDGARYIDNWDYIPEYPEYPGAPLKNNTFYGGNLYGVIEKLPYLYSLGVNLIYLSPIFEAASNHKYDTGDYMTVDSMFGGDDALKLLIGEAKRYNIDIILDGVFNHTGDDSIYFNRYGTYDSLGAYQSQNSPYYSWYKFDSFPDNYTSWWGIEILPRIHPDTPECKKYFTSQGGVIDKYSKMGIAGFRLDVVDELSDAFVSSIKSTLNENNKESILYGEVWEDASNKIAYDVRKRYYLGDELDGVMNYPLRKGIIEFLRDHKTSELEYALTSIINNAPSRIRNLQMNLLGTHDTLRILTALGTGDYSAYTNSELRLLRLSVSERRLAKLKLMQAYTILATLPGIPTIFYGDEAGLEGYSDPFNRMPYPWGREDAELIKHYQLIGSIRSKNNVYKEGSFELLHLSPDILAFRREAAGHSFITIVNNGDASLFVRIKDATPLLYNSFTVNKYTAEIFKARSNCEIELLFNY